MRQGLLFLVLLTTLGVSTGCDYSSDRVFRSDINSVHIEIFESKEFRRNLEFLLTEAVMKRVSSDTPYRIADKAQADTILSGEVLQVRQSAFAPDFISRQPRDVQMTMVIRVLWKDLRNGRILMDRPLLLQGIDYLPAAGESEAYAEQRVVDRMAARIVSQMYNDW